MTGMKGKGSCKGENVIVQFSTAPIGEGVGVSRFVAEALKLSTRRWPCALPVDLKIQPLNSFKPIYNVGYGVLGLGVLH